MTDTVRVAGPADLIEVVPYLLGFRVDRTYWQHAGVWTSVVLAARYDFRVIGDERDLQAIVLPRWGSVAPSAGVVPWLVLDETGSPLAAIETFLRDFVARGNSPSSVRSYAYALLRWWRWLGVLEVEWDRASSREVRDLALWLKLTTKPRPVRPARAGTVNPVTGKKHLDDTYAARTIRHCNAVLASFYEFWIESGDGPVVSPVIRERPRGRRANAHHNPMEPFRAEGRLRYNPKLPRQRPRSLSEDQWRDLFGLLRSHRDRAMLSLAVSSAARAGELLGVRGCDLDWGDQLVRVFRKGSGAEQWLPASPEAFVWLRLYFSEIDAPGPQERIWVTLRRRDRGQGLARQPLSYDALRAMLRRANERLGSNWTMHDLRHTCALRMAADESLSLRDVQTILGHAHLSTTADIYLVEDEARVLERAAAHLADRPAAHRANKVDDQGASLPAAPVVGYEAADLDVLFGTGGTR